MFIFSRAYLLIDPNPNKSLIYIKITKTLTDPSLRSLFKTFAHKTLFFNEIYRSIFSYSCFVCVLYVVHRWFGCGWFFCLFVGKSQHKKITQHLLDKLEVMGNRVPTGNCFFASASCCSLKTGFPQRSPTGLILKENTDPVQRNRESSVKAKVTFLRGEGNARGQGSSTRRDSARSDDPRTKMGTTYRKVSSHFKATPSDRTALSVLPLAETELERYIL